MKPAGVSSWIWLHPVYLDRQLWQSCVVRCRNMERVTYWAEKLYVKLGGKIETAAILRRRRRPRKVAV
jgi:hypothetical protein